jgi:hypothetical protein
MHEWLHFESKLSAAFLRKCLENRNIGPRYVQENVTGDTITQITQSEHDAGYSLNYEARQNASRLNQVPELDSIRAQGGS